MWSCTAAADWPRLGVWQSLIGLGRFAGAAPLQASGWVGGEEGKQGDLLRVEGSEFNCLGLGLFGLAVEFGNKMCQGRITEAQWLKDRSLRIQQEQ